jgi:hypothetical protein
MRLLQPVVLKPVINSTIEVLVGSKAVCDLFRKPKVVQSFGCNMQRQLCSVPGPSCHFEGAFCYLLKFLELLT